MTRPRARVCACHGPWQAVVLAAALETRRGDGDGDAARTVLALSGERLSPQIRQAMDAVGGLLGGFDEVIWIDDLVAGVEGLPERAFHERLASLRERLGVTDAAEIWTGNPRTAVDRALFEAYPGAGIVVFEDGLGTYAAPWSEATPRGERALETAKAVAKRLLGRAPSIRGAAFAKGVRLVGQRARAPSAAYLALAGRLGTPPTYAGVARTLPARALTSALRPLREAYPGPAVEGSGRRAVVLGGSYSFWAALERPEEEALYAGTVARLAEAGYEVWWKDHPRTLEPFLPELRRRVPGVPVGDFDEPAVPLEAQLRPDAFELVVAGTSTSLLYVPLLFGDGVRVATFADELAGRVSGVRRRIVELVRANVPALDAVLDCSRAESAPAVRER